MEPVKCIEIQKKSTKQSESKKLFKQKSFEHRIRYLHGQSTLRSAIDFGYNMGQNFHALSEDLPLNIIETRRDFAVGILILSILCVKKTEREQEKEKEDEAKSCKNNSQEYQAQK